MPTHSHDGARKSGPFRSAKRFGKVSALVAVAAFLVAAWMVNGDERGSYWRSLLSHAPWVQKTVEIGVDQLVREIDDDGNVFIDGAGLAALVQGLVESEEPLDSIRLDDVLDAAPRVRLTYHGKAIVVGSAEIRMAATRMLGDEAKMSGITVGDIMAALPNVLDAGESPHSGALGASTAPIVTLASAGVDDGLMALLADPQIAALAESVFGTIEQVAQSDDPQRLERQALESEYQAVVKAVRLAKASGYSEADPAVLHDAAYQSLAGSDDGDAAGSSELLDGHLRLQDEYASGDLQSLSLPERIEFRWEARRRAFGSETADLLFSRREALERYEVAQLELADNDDLSDEEKAGKTALGREDLKVELAEMGSFVGFADRDRPNVIAQLREQDADFDDLTEAQQSDAIQKVYMKRLSPELRAEIRQIRRRSASSSEPSARQRVRSFGPRKTRGSSDAGEGRS